MHSHKQSCNVFIVGRFMPCALVLLCLTAHLVPATGKPYTSSERDLFNDHGNAIERQEMISNDPLYASIVIQQLRLRMYNMIRKGAVKPMPSKRSGGVTNCLWKMCPTYPWLMSKQHTRQH